MPTVQEGKYTKILEVSVRKTKPLKRERNSDYSSKAVFYAR